MTDQPEVTVSKTRAKRTEYERALDRHRAKQAAVEKLKQRVEVQRDTTRALERELQTAEQQCELIGRMVELARDNEPQLPGMSAPDSPQNYPTELAAQERAAQ